MTKNKTLEGPELTDLVNQCMIVTDRKGTVLRKHGTPMTAELAMEYLAPYGKIAFDLSIAAQGNGAYEVRVTKDKKLVFKARGNYMSRPFNNTLERYVPGRWQEELNKEYHEIKK